MEWKSVKRLLLPYDFSENSKKATEYALAMAEKINCRIIIQHVFKIPLVVANEYTVSEVNKKFLDESKAELDKVANNLRNQRPEIKIETSFSSGDVVDEILNTASEKGSDMIIMGTQGACGIGENLFGSNTAEVIAKSSIPVLAVPKEAQYKPVKRVVFATSFLENDFQTLFQLTELMKPFNAEIEILHVEEKGEKASLQQHMEEFSQQVSTSILYKNISYKIIQGDNIEHALESYVEAEQVDLLAIASKRRNFFERITEKSLSRKLAFHTRIPLLVFHSYNRTGYPIL